MCPSPGAQRPANTASLLDHTSVGRSKDDFCKNDHRLAVLLISSGTGTAGNGNSHLLHLFPLNFCPLCASFITLRMLCVGSSMSK